VCARAVSVAVQEIDGVESVNVSLNDGLAVISFSAGTRASVAEIRRAISENGFSPKSADVRISGTVERNAAEGGLFLRIPGSAERFGLQDHPEGAAEATSGLASGEEGVVLEGEIPESDRRSSSSLVIRVRTVTREGSSRR
jgi:copper chaperone CopZ